jgi:hypothetical protein
MAVTVETSPTNSLPLIVLIGASVGIIAAAGTVIYLVKRKTGRNPPTAAIQKYPKYESLHE